MPQTPIGACSPSIWRLKNRFVQRRHAIRIFAVKGGQKRCI
jgi:hypothetical protein